RLLPCGMAVWCSGGRCAAPCSPTRRSSDLAAGTFAPADLSSCCAVHQLVSGRWTVHHNQRTAGIGSVHAGNQRAAPVSPVEQELEKLLNGIRGWTCQSFLIIPTD